VFNYKFDFPERRYEKSVSLVVIILGHG